MSHRHVEIGAKPLRHLGVHVGAGVVALEVGGLQDTILVQVAQREGVLGLLRTAVHCELMLVAEGVLVLQLVNPVLVPSSLGIRTNHAGGGVYHVVPRVVLERVVLLATHIAAQLCSCGSLAVGPTQTVVEDVAVAQSFVGELHKVLLTYQVVVLQGAVRPAGRRAPGHLGLTLLTLLGGDHHHTVGTTGTIQGTCRSILQDSHRLDVGGVQ